MRREVAAPRALARLMRGAQLIVVALIFSTAVAPGTAYPGGAPASGCANGPTGHGSVGSISASGDGVFSFAIGGNSANTYLFSHTASQALTVTLSGGTFKGFLVRAVDESGAYVGSFASSCGGGVQRMSGCGGGAAVTHTSDAAKTSVSCTWTAPASSGSVVFEAFVVVAKTSNHYRLFAPHAAGDSSLRGPTRAPTKAPTTSPSAPTIAPSAAPTAKATKPPTAKEKTDTATIGVAVVSAIFLLMFAWHCKEQMEGKKEAAEEHSAQEQSRRNKRKNSATVALEAAIGSRPRGFGGWD